MPIGIGILGTAHGHVGAYCDQWKNMQSEAQLCGVWDHDAGRAGEFARKFAVSAEPTATALLARGDVEAVVIGAETSLHAELVEQAAAAGKKIILQKPMALTTPQADRIVAAVAKAGVPFTLAWQMRADPQNLKMRQLVKDGVIGRVFMLRRRHCLSTHTWAGFENSWHVNLALNRGMWADDASHAIDFVYWMLGEPATVSAEIATLHNPKVPDDNGIAVFRYADGTFAEVSSSFTALAGQNTTEITGEKGAIIQDFGDGPSCGPPKAHEGAGLRWLLREGADAGKWIASDIPSPAGHGARIAALAKPLLEFLHGRRPPIATAEEGRTSLRMTLACYESASQGRRVLIG